MIQEIKSSSLRQIWRQTLGDTWQQTVQPGDWSSTQRQERTQSTQTISRTPLQKDLADILGTQRHQTVLKKRHSETFGNRQWDKPAEAHHRAQPRQTSAEFSLERYWRHQQRFLRSDLFLAKRKSVIDHWKAKIPQIRIWLASILAKSLRSEFD